VPCLNGRLHITSSWNLIWQRSLADCSRSKTMAVPCWRGSSAAVDSCCKLMLTHQMLACPVMLRHFVTTAPPELVPTTMSCSRCVAHSVTSRSSNVPALFHVDAACWLLLAALSSCWTAAGPCDSFCGARHKHWGPSGWEQQRLACKECSACQAGVRHSIRALCEFHQAGQSAA
jgi:hypothetical protein